MADQKLNAAKVEYLDTDLGGATNVLVPEAWPKFQHLGDQCTAKLSWLSQFDDINLGRGVSSLEER